MESKGGVRFANANDWQKVSQIYNEIIDERIATLNTEHNTSTDVSKWINEGVFLVYNILCDLFYIYLLEKFDLRQIRS